MPKPAALSGFPEWLPAERLVEQHMSDQIRHTFELFGFSNIETRAVEPLGDLLRKGETSKEVYLLRRLQEVDATGTNAKTLGLHFDLTVPLARYVLQNAGHLEFPFKRYQMQKVWRGERPQTGRFREFAQADIDVVGRDTLPFHYDVEVLLAMVQALKQMPIGDFVVLVNNRKLSEGFYRGIGIDDVIATLQWIDKLDKIGERAVIDGLLAEVGASESQARACLELASIRGSDRGVIDRIRDVAATHEAKNELFENGLKELEALLESATRRAGGHVEADMKIARGLDYYTGSVYETVLVGHEELGSVCSGGRYESLASDGKTTYPGVGMSIGLSRLVSFVLSQDEARASRAVPSCVLIAVPDDDARPRCEEIADALRARDIPCEVSPDAAKFGKQIKYADKRGIPYVWFPGGAGERDGVKDIRSGEQRPADPQAWEPEAGERWPRISVSLDGQ